MKKYGIYFCKNRKTGEVVYIGPDKYKLMSDRYETKLHCTCNSYEEMRKLVKNLSFLYFIEPKKSKTFKYEKKPIVC